jgi:hypothetical protein
MRIDVVERLREDRKSCSLSGLSRQRRAFLSQSFLPASIDSGTRRLSKDEEFDEDAKYEDDANLTDLEDSLTRGQRSRSILTSKPCVKLQLSRSVTQHSGIFNAAYFDDCFALRRDM